MKYRVNEIFKSVQAEGANAGTPAIFVRFAGCNLECPFCDTQHQPFTKMDADEIRKEINRLADGKVSFVVFTGGEPAMQLKEDENLAPHYDCAIETNGTLNIPSWIDWVTVSPKTKEAFQPERISELKVLFNLFEMEKVEQWIKGLPPLIHFYLQPIERDGKFNTQEVVDYILLHPHWRISVQWHKLTGVR